MLKGRRHLFFVLFLFFVVVVAVKWLTPEVLTPFMASHGTEKI